MRTSVRSSRLAAIPITAVVAGVLGASACPKPAAVDGMAAWSEPEPAASKSTVEPGPSDTALEMHQRFRLVVAMRDALVHGDVPTVRAHATELDHALEEAQLAAGWQSRVDELRRSLRVFETDVEVDEAAAHFAEVGRRCGACHEAEGVSATVPEPARPAEAASAESRMALHAWAAARMWEGLVRPSDDDWKRGTTTFLVLPGCDQAYPDATGPRRELCEYVRGLAIPSHLAEDPSRKAELYGRLVSTCAACHATDSAGG